MNMEEAFLFGCMFAAMCLAVVLLVRAEERARKAEEKLEIAERDYVDLARDYQTLNNNYSAVCFKAAETQQRAIKFQRIALGLQPPPWK